GRPSRRRNVRRRNRLDVRRRPIDDVRRPRDFAARRLFDHASNLCNNPALNESESGEDLVTHNYVFVESVALLQARLGVDAAIKLARDSTTFIIDWVDEEMHASGIRALH